MAVQFDLEGVLQRLHTEESRVAAILIASEETPADRALIERVFTFCEQDDNFRGCSYDDAMRISAQAILLARKIGEVDRARSLYDFAKAGISHASFLVDAALARAKGDVQAEIQVYESVGWHSNAEEVARKHELTSKAAELYDAAMREQLEQGNFSFAGRIAENHGELDRALQLYVQGKNFFYAAQLLKKKADTARADEFLESALQELNRADPNFIFSLRAVASEIHHAERKIQVFEEFKEFEEAGRVAEENGQIDPAKRFYERASEEYERNGRTLEAYDSALKSGNSVRTQATYEQLKVLPSSAYGAYFVPERIAVREGIEQAIAYCEQTGRFFSAFILVEKSGNTQKLREFCEAFAPRYEHELRSLRRSPDDLRIMAPYFSKETLERLCQTPSVLEQPAIAAQVWENAGDLALAAEFYEKAGQKYSNPGYYSNAAEIQTTLGNHLNAP